MSTTDPDELKGEALAAAVAVEVMGWEQRDATHWYEASQDRFVTRCEIRRWRPDRDANQAMKVLNSFGEGYVWELERAKEGWWVELILKGWHYASAKTPPEETTPCVVICRTAIKAMRRKAADAVADAAQQKETDSHGCDECHGYQRVS